MKAKSFFLLHFDIGLLMLLLMVFSACRPKTNHYEPTYMKDSTEKKTLLYGVPTQAFYEMHIAFVKYLNERLPKAHIQIVASPSFSAYISKMNKGFFDLADANGIMTFDIKPSTYSLTGESVGEEPNAGAILVNKDSLINNFSDLKGKLIASPGSPALPGHMLQMVYLFKKGLNVNKDVRLKYLESFESVILNVYLGKCSAGFVSMIGWHSFLKQRPEIASRVALKWITPATQGNTLLIRKNVNEETASQLRQMILTMHTNHEGRKALADLGYVKFLPADTNTYRPLKDFLKEYRELIKDPKY
jgi:phosphonate transport system substrate-binding protein